MGWSSGWNQLCFVRRMEQHRLQWSLQRRHVRRFARSRKYLLCSEWFCRSLRVLHLWSLLRKSSIRPTSNVWLEAERVHPVVVLAVVRAIAVRTRIIAMQRIVRPCRWAPSFYWPSRPYLSDFVTSFRQWTQSLILWHFRNTALCPCGFLVLQSTVLC